MSMIPLGRGAFERIGAPESRLVNMLYEQNPTNQEDQTSFLQRWGTSLYKTCGSGPIRGIIQFGAFLIVVSGADLYKITSGGTVTQISGTVSGTKRVSMATDGVEVFIGTSAGFHSTDAFTMSDVQIGGNAASVRSVAYIAGYFLANPTNTDTVNYAIRTGGNVVFGALDFYTAEFAPDYLQGIEVVGDYAYHLGTTTTEPWTATGNPDSPFQRVRGSLYTVGCADRATAAKIDNTLYFVGSDRVAYRLANGPQRVSDHSIDERLRAATDLRAWSYIQDGHGLWVITTGNETLVFDVTTGQWTEFKSYGLGYFRGHLGLQTDASRMGADSVVTLAADAVNGKIWQLTAANCQDDGGPLVRECMGAIDATGGVARCDTVQLYCTMGSTPLDEDPMTELRVSDDWETWSDWRPAPLGRAGQFRNRAAWTRLGLIRPPGRLFHNRTAANCNVVVRKLRMNEPLR